MLCACSGGTHPIRPATVNNREDHEHAPLPAEYAIMWSSSRVWR